MDKANKSKRPLENKFYQYKINFFMLFIFLIMGVVSYRLYELQVTENPYLTNQAASNTKQIVRLPSYRGEIFLSDNSKLAENLSVYTIYLHPQYFPRRKDSKEFKKAIKKITDNFNISEEKILSVLKRAVANPYSLYRLQQGVDEKKIFFLAEHLDQFPFLDYRDAVERYYPRGEVFSHISGYVQTINIKELKSKQGQGYFPESVIGKMGIEAYHDLELRGKDGYKINIVDVKNRIKEEIFPREGKVIPGKNLHLTIDPKVQDILHRTMQGFSGGAIVTKVKTGEVLGLYSYPLYDPNIFLEKKWGKFKEYLADKQKPFLNRVTQAQFPPSSIFKLVVGMAALDDPKITPYNVNYKCEGKLIIGDSQFKCTAYHGWQTFQQAIANSCNVFFYKLGMRITPQTIQKYAETYFNFGKLTGIDLMYEKKGRIPSPKWKLENRGASWWDGDTANFSIGQGFALTTVAQINSITAAIANDGKGNRLHLVRDYEALEDGKREYVKPSLAMQLPFSKKNIKFLQKSMRQVVKWGTARRINNPRLLIAGKTGTAQNIKGKENHAWFTGYAPYTESNNPKKRDRQVAVTVIVEHGGYGSIYAATFTDAILQAMFLNRDPLLVIKERLQPWTHQEAKYKHWLAVRKEQKLEKGDFTKKASAN